MLDLINRNKTFIGIVVVTLIILFAGIPHVERGTESTSTLISEDSQNQTPARNLC